MRKNLLLYILLLFLILVNGFFIYNYLGDNKSNKEQLGPKREKDPSGFLVKELRFNDAQLKQVEELNMQHRRSTREALDEIKNLKDALFNEILLDNASNSKIDSLLTLISKQEEVKERNTITLLRSLYNISDERQKMHFKKIMKDALLLGNPKGMGDRRPPPRQ